MTTDEDKSQVPWERWLRTCAPFGHTFEDTGIRMTPMMREVGAITEHLERVLECRVCGKTGFERTVTCETCDFYPARVPEGLVLVLPDGVERRGVPLCPSCHLAFINGVGGVAVEWDT